MSQSNEPTPDTVTIETTTSPLTFPNGFEMSTSWERAQQEHDSGGWINDAERMVWLDNSAEPHRVTFVLCGRVLRVDCGCKAHHYRDWCAHVASCWWDWINGKLSVSHMQTGKEYHFPPQWLDVATRGKPTQYDELTPKELEAYLHCELGEYGVTEYADATDRVKGTIGNQLADARDKVEARQ